MSAASLTGSNTQRTSTAYDVPSETPQPWLKNDFQLFVCKNLNFRLGNLRVVGVNLKKPVRGPNSGRNKTFFSSPKTPTTAQRRTQPPVQWVPGFLPGSKAAGHELTTYPPTCLHVVYRENFTFTFIRDLHLQRDDIWSRLRLVRARRQRSNFATRRKVPTLI
jgi:hypothetical protein